MNNSTPRRGRPSAFTPQKARIILNAIRQSLSYKQAAALARISYMTFNRWRSEGESDDAPKPLRDFCDQLKATEAELANSLVKMIFDSGKAGNWKAAAWILERRYPDEWGKREPTVDAMENLRKMSGYY